jgi:hypothetical protein
LTHLVDVLCLLGLILLGAYAIDYGDYLSGVLILNAVILAVFLRRRWQQKGPTNAARAACLLDEL